MATQASTVDMLTPFQLTTALQRPVVRVQVGQGLRTYHVHANLLCHHSGWFKTQIGLPERPSRTVIQLLDTDPGTFNLFVHYVYSQTFPTMCEDLFELTSENDFDEQEYANDTEVDACVDALKLGVELSAPSFYTAINNYFVREFSNGTDLTLACYLQHDVRDLCETVPKNRVLLQFLVDKCCLKWTIEELIEAVEIPRDFLLRCLQRASEIICVQGQQSEAQGKRCYLEHASAEEKQECAKLHMRYDEKLRHGFFEP